MRPRHTQHSLTNFPIHSAAFVASDRLVVGGGGGSTKSGIKNKLRLYSIGSDRSIELKNEIEIEDAPTSMSADLKASSRHPLAKVTTFSPDCKLVAVAGCHNLSILSFPNLEPAASSIQLEKEISDATFSSTGETLVVATTHNLHVYSIKSRPETSSSKKNRSKNKAGSSTGKMGTLELLQAIELPSSLGGSGACTFRSARYHPSNDSVMYTVINTSPPRERGRKTPARQGYVLKWNTQTWTVEKQKKVGDKALTAFDVSLDGRFLGYGSSDLSIGILDPKTLTPLCTVLKAHEFPPTAVKFDPTTRVIASGSVDNTLRIVTIPEVVGGFSWTIVILALVTALIVLIAIAMQGKRLGW
ncbi:hypothetical protein NP233_g1273 [Leucocoprinus birnbaumii]|uniref:WD40 repeat-like protein n=1 Tax=Leucocoprinus birnbaumii TaxID=56174 RepID=A0AAD5YUZ9_9AGAR|nr:hypothetical protein NP233_g1273 [Leucocoprinus birnbaumii]